MIVAPVERHRVEHVAEEPELGQELDAGAAHVEAPRCAELLDAGAQTGLAAQVIRVPELEQAAPVVLEEPALDETVDLVEIDQERVHRVGEPVRFGRRALVPQSADVQARPHAEALSRAAAS